MKDTTALAKSNSKKTNRAQANAVNATLVKMPEVTQSDTTRHKPSAEEVRQMIATAAYFHAEKRSFSVGYEQEDWLMAEKEIGFMLSA